LIIRNRSDLLFCLVRLAGFEPATGCLEDMAWLYGTVSHLDFVVLGVRPLPTSLVSSVGVGQLMIDLRAASIRSFRGMARV
jgi:hypothetical protein